MTSPPTPAPGPAPAAAAIHSWSGEFVDAATERAYRAEHQQAMAQQQRLGVGIWGVTMVLFALPDYAQMGPSREFWLLTAYRLAMAVLLAMAFMRLGRKPELAPASTTVMWLGLAGYPFFFLFYVLRPDLRALNTAMIMLLQLSLFVFLPGRALQYVPVVTFGAVGAAFTMWSVGVAPPVVMGVIFALALPAIVGYASAVRLQRAQRQEYHLRQQLLAVNQGLQAEVQRRIALEVELQNQASTDALTGLRNRRAFEHQANNELHRARRSLQPLSVGLLDIDHFKQVNDGLGHAAGDAVLRTVGALFASRFRCEDAVGRIGGEEFAVVLPGATLEQAGEVMQRFLDTLGSTPVEVGPHRVTVTATVGVVQHSPGAPTLENLLSRADSGLYAGKREGRNRVMLALPEGGFARYVRTSDVQDPPSSGDADGAHHPEMA
ncbi:GGDEF domain-containing protein [Paracidovorax sp. MALMAid1276]|uniref:GGDEF domain-containing protein n=1 Tax=Paracidovorax sp. MALMAid1276 TaxID=3411631 RepID=UPI003B98F3BB